MKIAVALGIVASLMFPVAGMAAENLGAIQGSVRDNSGIPVVGALVIVMSMTPSAGERMVFTDNRGTFSIPNLLVGEYSVKVTMSRFLPASKGPIQLNGGTTAILSLNLQTALDVFRRVSTQDGKNAQDMVWVLRSSRATQPVLRLLDQTKDDSQLSSDYSGFLQIFSTSTESSMGNADGVGSRFSVTMPLQSRAKVTVDGQYSDSPDQPRGFGATYEFAPGENHQSRVSMNMRQAGLLNGTFPGEDLSEIQIKYSEKLQLLNHLIFDYSAETGKTAGRTNDHYFRPALGLSLVPNSRTTIGASATAESPAKADDPIRGKEYFDQQSFLPSTRQGYRHAEINASRIVSGTTKFTAAVFKDQATDHILFVSNSGGSGSFLILDGRNTPSQGVRMFVNRDFKSFGAGVGYTVASGLGLKSQATSVDDVRDQMRQRQFHVVTARVKTGVDITNTELTAVYRWISPLAGMAIDPYQSNTEYNDPSLSITVVQTLPTWGTFPGKVQAILDARNLFEQATGNHGVAISNSPRLLKGGINFRF